MIRRTAALFAIVAFALAWVVGVWCGASPRPRLESALLALVAGGVAGALIGVALQNIVLARLSEQWREAAAAPKEAAKAAGKATATTGATSKPGATSAPAPGVPSAPIATGPSAAKPVPAPREREPAGAAT